MHAVQLTAAPPNQCTVSFLCTRSASKNKRQITGQVEEQLEVELEVEDQLLLP